MKSSDNILGSFYRLLLDKGVDSLVDGNIVRGEYVQQDQKTGIEINALDNRNAYLQSGVINLNVLMLRNVDGHYDSKGMEELSTQICSLLEDNVFESIRFQIAQESGPQADPFRDEFFINNFRFNFYTIR